MFWIFHLHVSMALPALVSAPPFLNHVGGIERVCINVLKVFPTDDRGREKRDWPFTAIRLENGNTLIGCTNGNRVIEVDGEGKIVWSVDNDDLGEALIDDACGIQRLPNGNTVISSYHASGDRVKLFEVTPDKKVVWRYSGMPAGFHHFQILTTNGKPVEPNTWK